MNSHDTPNTKIGHILAILTIAIWGTTYVATKVLLKTFTPIEILFIRFVMGYLALWIISPHLLKFKSLKQEAYFALAGFFGITLYYLLENIALVYTMASNVGVIVSVAPFFTAIFTWLILKEYKPGGFFFLGFVIAMLGISIISFQSQTTFSVNPLGDMLALLAAVTWALYSIVARKLGGFGYSVIQTTRRTFFYGLIFMLPVLGFSGFSVNLHQIFVPEHLLNLLFLGLGASALCFVTWNASVAILGVVKTSVYIYAVPVITAATSVIVLHEKLNFISISGIVLTLIGLGLSGKGKE